MAWLSEVTGIRQTTLSEYNRQAAPRVDKALLIARALDVDVEWLFGDQIERKKSQVVGSEIHSPRRTFAGFPDQPAPTSSVDLHEYEISYAMGGGAMLGDHAEVKTIAFPRDWLRPIIRGSFDQVFIARGEGDSMQPTLLDGDITIIDTAQRALNSQDRLWAIQYGELGMIKRLRAQPDGGILVLSDNPTVAAFTAYDGEVQLIGRVVWIGRRV